MTFDEWNAEPYSRTFEDAWKAGAASRDAEVAELKADAERYRWLCSTGMSMFHPAFSASSLTSWKTKAEIDDGIDRARSTK